MSDSRVDSLLNEAMRLRLSRRSIMRRGAALGLSTAAVASVLLSTGRVSAAPRAAALTRPVDDRTPATAAVESPSAAPRRMMLRRESRSRMASLIRESIRGSVTEVLLATEWLGRRGRVACAPRAGRIRRCQGHSALVRWPA